MDGSLFLLETDIPPEAPSIAPPFLLKRMNDSIVWRLSEHIIVSPVRRTVSLFPRKQTAGSTRLNNGRPNRSTFTLRCADEIRVKWRRVGTEHERVTSRALWYVVHTMGHRARGEEWNLGIAFETSAGSSVLWQLSAWSESRFHLSGVPYTALGAHTRARDFFLSPLFPPSPSYAPSFVSTCEPG